MSWVQQINSLSTEYAPLLNAVSVIWLPLSTMALFLWFALKKIKKYFFFPKSEIRNLTPEEREIFYEVYDNLYDGLVLVSRDGHVSHDALALFWRARDQARLELPVDIQQYTETLLEAAIKALTINEVYLYSTRHKSLPVGKERSEKVAEHDEYLSILLDAEPP